MNIEKSVGNLYNEIQATEKKLNDLQKKRQLVDQLINELAGFNVLVKSPAIKVKRKSQAARVPYRIQRLRVLNLLKNEGPLLASQIVNKIRPDICVSHHTVWCADILGNMTKAGFLSRSLTEPQGKFRRQKFLYRLGPNASAILRTNSEPCAKLV